MSKKKSKRQEQIEAESCNIIETAALGGDNKLSKDITFAQAVSIRLRSKQLIKENIAFTKSFKEVKESQINHCWSKRGK